MIEEIEGLKPELQAMSLCEREIFQHREIPRKSAWRCARVSPKIAVKPVRSLGVTSGIEPSGRSRLKAIIRVDTRCIRTIESLARVGRIAALRDIEGIAALDRDNRSNLPSAYDRIQEAILDIKTSALATGRSYNADVTKR